MNNRNLQLSSGAEDKFINVNGKYFSINNGK